VIDRSLASLEVLGAGTGKDQGYEIDDIDRINDIVVVAVLGSTKYEGVPKSKSRQRTRCFIKICLQISHHSEHRPAPFGRL
jgi:hypothetical protein